MQIHDISSKIFTNIPLVFFNTIGVKPFQVLDANSRPLAAQSLTNFLAWILFFVGYTNMVLCVLGEMVYVVLTFGRQNNFVELTEVILCIGFIVLSIVKVVTVIWQRQKTNLLIAELNRIFPVTPTEQSAYKADDYCKNTVRLMTIYTWLQMVMIWLYNLSPILDTIIGYISAGTWEMNLPYVVWYPFDPYPRGWFELNFVSQIWAAYIASAGMLATDLLLCGMVLEICMHFDQLSRELLSLRPGVTRINGGRNLIKDNAILKDCIQRHKKILRLSVYVDDIFGASILFNFVSSVVIICVVGFLVAISGQSPHLIKYALTLLSCTTQLYLVCFLGDKFIESSVGVANAAWQSEWFDADLLYKKKLLMVIMRGHRPQYLRAYKFSVASMNSFSQLLSTSWQFFAILHSVYEK